MNSFDTALALARVLASGTIMSIEKNEGELPALAGLLRERTGWPYVSLFNSVTGAIHAALWGQGIGHGDAAPLEPATDQERRLARWLGVRLEPGPGKPYRLVSAGPEGSACLRELLNEPSRVAVVVLDLTPLGFGPCAAMLAREELVFQRAERLKIFGAFDLRTMWTQEEAAPGLEVGVQFNYRLSPLVAACARLALLQRNVVLEVERV